MTTDTPPDQPLLRAEALRKRRAEGLRNSRELGRLVEAGDLVGLAVLMAAGIGLASFLGGAGPDPTAAAMAEPAPLAAAP